MPSSRDALLKVLKISALPASQQFPLQTPLLCQVGKMKVLSIAAGAAGYFTAPPKQKIVFLSDIDHSFAAQSSNTVVLISPPCISN